MPATYISGRIVEEISENLYNYITGRMNGVDLCRYDQYLDALYETFVPSIFHRLLKIVNFLNENRLCQIIIKRLKECLELNILDCNLLRIDGVSHYIIDSLLITNRIQLICWKCQNIAVWLINCDENVNTLSDYVQHLKSQIMAGCIKGPITSNDGTSKFLNNELCGSKDQRLNDSLDNLSDCAQCNSSDSNLASLKHFVPQIRCNELKFIIKKRCPGGLCVCSEDTVAQLHYLHLPCVPDDIIEKIFDDKRVSVKLEECLKSLCKNLNKLIDKMNNDQVNNLILTCDVKKKYLDFKLRNVKSKINRLIEKGSCLKDVFRNQTINNKCISQCCNKINLRSSNTKIGNNIFKESKFKNIKKETADSSTKYSCPSENSFTTSFDIHDAACDDNTNFSFECKLIKESSSIDCRSLIQVDKEYNVISNDSCNYEKEEYGHHDQIDSLLSKLKHNIKLITEKTNVTKADKSTICKRMEFQEVGLSKNYSKNSGKMYKFDCKNKQNNIENKDVNGTYTNDASHYSCRTKVEKNNPYKKDIDKMIKNAGFVERVQSNTKSLNTNLDIGTDTLGIDMKENTAQSSLLLNFHQKECAKYVENKGSLLKKKENIKKTGIVNKRCLSSIEQEPNELNTLNFDFINVLESKLAKIATISAKIHEKCTNTEVNDLSFYSNKLLNCSESSEKINFEIDLESSLISIKSKGKKGRVNKQLSSIEYYSKNEKLHGISKRLSFTNSPYFYKKFHKRRPRRKEFLVTEAISMMETSPLLKEKLKNKVQKLKKRKLKTFCCPGKFSQGGDALHHNRSYTHNRTFKRRIRKSFHSLMKAFYLINIMSYTYMKNLLVMFKKVLYCTLNNILEKKKMKDNSMFLAKSRCPCCRQLISSTTTHGRFYEKLNFSDASIMFECFCDYHNKFLRCLTSKTDIAHRGKRIHSTECDPGFFINASKIDSTCSRGSCANLDSYQCSKISKRRFNRN